MTQDEIIDMWHAANGVKIKGAEYDVVATFAQLVTRRAWVGLTNQELADCWDTIPERAMRRVEAKLKEKNT